MSINVPQSLRGIAHYVKIAQEYSQRDIVIYYWALYYAVQAGMKIDRASPEAMQFLATTLGNLETIKKANANRDDITQDVVAQAYIENHALKLFNFADEHDRAANFTKNVVKAYYTAGHLFDILTTFGELDESLEKARKYAKWKATYIHTCLKNGETPVAGPPGEKNTEGVDNAGDDLDAPPPAPSAQDFGFQQPPPRSQNNLPPQKPHDGYSIASNPDPSQQPGYPNQGAYGFQQFPQHQPYQQPNQPTPPPRPSVQPQQHHQQPTGGYSTPASASSSSHHMNMVPSSLAPASDLKLEDFLEAKKLIKFAMSATDYEDAPAAIENMMKAIRVLQKLPPS